MKICLKFEEKELCYEFYSTRYLKNEQCEITKQKVQRRNVLFGNFICLNNFRLWREKKYENKLKCEIKK